MVELRKYVIEREIPGAGQLTDEELREVSMRSVESLQRLGPQIQWIHSFVTDNKVYCVYLAPDEETVRKHAEMTGIPASRISAVRRLLDPTSAN
jgi:Nickel responsive protein SCO4226-like